VETPDVAPPTQVTVLGWAYVPHDPVTAVVVSVDDEPAALARLGLPAPDVATTRGSEDALLSGWAAEVDLSAYPAQRVVVGATATTARGLAEALTPHTVVVGDGVSGDHLSLQVSESSAPDVLFLTGTTATAQLPSRVEIIVDGRPAGPARLLTGPTPDLGSQQCVQARVAGFTHVVQRPPTAPGARTSIEAVVQMLDGTTIRIGPIGNPAPDATPTPTEVPALRARVLQRVSAPPPQRAPRVRLLVVTHALTLGGGEFFLLELLHGLLTRATDFSCVVVAPRDGPLRSRLEALGATVHLAGQYPVDSPAGYESRLADLAALARYHGSNVAIVNTVGASIGADLAAMLSIPYVWAIHESFRPELFWAEAYGPKGYDPYIRARSMEALGTANGLVFEADATKALFADAASADRLATFRYGIGLAEIDSFRSSRGRRRRGGEIELLNVGVFQPRKAQTRLALAFSRIADEYPKARLSMVGAGDDAYTRDVRDLVRRLRLGDRIRLVPVTDDLYSWYERADALVSASDIESLPRSVLEAMAFDVPIVAADVYGISEVITDGDDGILVSARDLGGLVAGLRRFLELDSRQRAALGRAGGHRVRSMFSSDHVAVWEGVLGALVDDPTMSLAAALERHGERKGGAG
jgi:glycosyltransferase involved in cell wall biosynthesis